MTSDLASVQRPGLRLGWSLTGLLALLAAAGLHVTLSIRSQFAAIEEIERLGGSIEIRQTGPAWLRRHAPGSWMNGIDEVVGVTLISGELRDADLKTLNSFKSLRRLYLGGNLTDAAIAELKPLKCLERLYLCHQATAAISPAAVREIQTALPHLEIVLE